jgi:hypothetical protein
VSNLVAGEEVDATLAGGPEHVRAAETAEVDDGPDQVADAGSGAQTVADLVGELRDSGKQAKYKKSG